MTARPSRRQSIDPRRSPPWAPTHPPQPRSRSLGRLLLVPTNPADSLTSRTTRAQANLKRKARATPALAPVYISSLRVRAGMV